MAHSWSIDAVWDIECAGWDRFLCGVLWTRKRGIEVFRTAEGLADALMSLPAGTQAWAHSGGKYDVLWLLDHLTRASGGINKKIVDAKVTMSGSSATSVKFKKRVWLRDSARLIPMSLARAAKIAGEFRSKGDSGIPFEELHEGMTPEQWASVLAYCVSDVELLRDVLIEIERYASEQGIELRGTIGSTAWSTAVKWCHVDEADWKWRDYEFCREGYYGGLCSVGRTTADTIYRYDRKSAYPASLTLPVPVGDSEVLDSDRAGDALAGGLVGAYRCRVSVPESHAPPLPHRYRDRLTYPYGTFEGTWSWIHLQHAIAQGVTIEKVKKAIVWRQEEPILKEFSDRCFALRDGLEHAWEKNALGQWLKFLANSLTGKLGQSPDFRIVVIGDYADDPRYEQVGTSPWVWSRKASRIPDCALVHMAMTLTSRAQVEVHEQIIHAGDDWVYTDTDSCFATRELTRAIGNKLGDFGFEGIGRSWKCKAPKVYEYDDLGIPGDDRKPTGVWLGYVGHAKGIPGSTDGEHVNRETWRQYAAGEEVKSDRGVKSLLVAARGEKLFERRHLSRRLRVRHDWVGARLRAAGGETRAPHVTALARL